MIDVKEVLRRWSAGQADRKIARESGADRKTIARYTKAAIKLGLEQGCELARSLTPRSCLGPATKQVNVPTEELNRGGGRDTASPSRASPV